MTREEALNIKKTYYDEGDIIITDKEVINIKEFNEKINKIYDDFESRTCENCKTYYKTRHKNYKCEHAIDICYLDRGCSLWEFKMIKGKHTKE